MEGLDKVLKECSVAEVYCSNGGVAAIYQIPIYQRNYAWGREEIRTLIKDAYDAFTSQKYAYYIGTLVIYKRDENLFEVIDGQQRLTTLFIILSALGVPISSHLTFSARKVSSKTIDALAAYSKNQEANVKCDLGEEYDNGIKAGFEYAREGITQIVSAKDKVGFKDYLLGNVHVIRYQVPKDVDLNHYFEVMNSRGEQLEKHEIVKARLCEKLSREERDMFSQIWEACSDMGIYVQLKLPKTELFGSGLRDFAICSYDELLNSFSHSVSDKIGESKKTISELLLGAPEENEEGKPEYDGNDSFLPIIDFQNFLLVVLKITRLKSEGTKFTVSDFTLDDKDLINEFGKVEVDDKFVKLFAYNLLKAKYFLDNYMVHHVDADDKPGENPWKLQLYGKDENNKASVKNLMGDDDKQSELVHLLSMFEVAFTARQRKNYLFYCLLHLFDDCDNDSYLDFMRRLADKYFFDIYLDKSKLSDTRQPKPNSFDETLIEDCKLNLALSKAKPDYDFCDVYTQGSSDIPLFVFNYTDYRLWKKYADELRGERAKKDSLERKGFFAVLGCSDFGLAPFDNFYFSRTRKSLEHFYPQAKAGEGKPISTDGINCFGNFAMIGADANSSGSNWNPLAKVNHYLDSKSNPVSVASLKFLIMLKICQDNVNKERVTGLEWNVDDIMTHQQKMLGVLGVE